MVSYKALNTLFKSVFLYVGKAIKKSRNIYEIFGKMIVFSI